MSTEPVKRSLARNAAAAIHGGFDDYHNEFKAIARRAQDRFERREWAAWQEDAIERLGLREQVIQRLVTGLRVMLGEQASSYYLWAAIKDAYARLINQRRDVEIAETFYNSVTRRILTTVGVEADLEFVWFGATTIPTGDTPIVRVYSQISTIAGMVKAILRDYAFAVPYQDIDGDAQRVAQVMEGYLRGYWDTPDFDTVEMLQSVFYRNKGAYLVGRIRKRNRVIPVILPLLNLGDEPRRWHHRRRRAAFRSEDDASVVFSFTRSYFPRRSGNVRATWSAFSRASCRSSRWRSCTLPSATTSTARPNATARSIATWQQLQRQIRDRARGARHGDDRFHAALLRHGLQDHQGSFRLSQDIDARPGDGSLQAGLQARPRRAHGRRAGVRVSELSAATALHRSCFRSCRKSPPTPSPSPTTR
jgi:hypothetical protein